VGGRGRKEEEEDLRGKEKKEGKKKPAAHFRSLFLNRHKRLLVRGEREGRGKKKGGKKRIGIEGGSQRKKEWGDRAKKTTRRKENRDMRN